VKEVRIIVRIYIKRRTKSNRDAPNTKKKDICEVPKANPFVMAEHPTVPRN